MHYLHFNCRFAIYIIKYLVTKLEQERKIQILKSWLWAKHLRIGNQWRKFSLTVALRFRTRTWGIRQENRQMQAQIGVERPHCEQHMYWLMYWKIIPNEHYWYRTSLVPNEGYLHFVTTDIHGLPLQASLW